ncbi:MAG: leucine-rich repeat protein [Lachnospiraceae bacterium]|nr:leucine-rich repeat protein [Lachnospiraceae bacterium]
MKKRISRIIGLLLSAGMVMTSVPVEALAYDEPVDVIEEMIPDIDEIDITSEDVEIITEDIPAGYENEAVLEDDIDMDIDPYDGETGSGTEEEIEEETDIPRYGDPATGGDCGKTGEDEVTWAITGQGNNLTLTISGTGAMADFSSSSYQPWKDSRNNIKTLVIETGVTSIGNYAFQSFKYVTSVTTPGSVTSIGSYAFGDCDAVTSIILPASVIGIANAAFNGCDNLASINIPADLEAIQNDTFTSCKNLATVTIPEGSNLKSIGSQAFRYCEKLTAIALPEGLTSIGSRAFDSCTGFSSFTLPSTLTTLGSYAFYNCTNLTSIELPASLTTMDTNVFYGCSKLAAVTFAEGFTFTKIPNNTFYNCRALTAITIPASVTTVGEYAFYGCSALATVTFAGTPAVTTISDHAFQSCTVLSQFEIPASVTTIGTYAFQNCDALASVEFPAGLTTLKDHAFQYCDVLKTVKFNGTTLTLNTTNDSYVFDGCPKLDTVTLPAGLTTIPKGWFEACTSLESIEIPSTVTTIGESAFNSCSKLDGVELPSVLVSLGTNTFKNCTSLTAPEIPETVTTLGDNTFEGCIGLSSFSSGSITTTGSEVFKGCTGLATCSLPKITKVTNSMFINCSSLESFTVPDTATEIASNAFNGCASLATFIFAGTSKVGKIYSSAFKNCTSLTSINIPASVTTLEQNAFDGCTSLTAINVDENNTAFYDINGAVYRMSDNILYIKPAAYTGNITVSEGVTKLTTTYFKGNTTVTTINLPASITTIDEGALEGCTALETVTFAEGSALTTIGKKAFYNCTSLETIVLPAGVTSIGESAFENCSSLASINVPKGVTSFPNYLFKGCTDLATVTFAQDSTMTTLGGQYAFQNCESLESFTVPSSVTTIGGRVFYGCTGLQNITLPDSGLTTIDYQAFYGCTALTGITLKSGLTKIGYGAFQDCTSITSVSLPSGITSFGDDIFKGCTSLSSATIPNDYQTLGKYMFQGCTSLTTLNLPTSLKTIPTCFLLGATSLNKITIPSSVTAINGSAFSGCTSLISVTIPDSVTDIEDAFRACTNLATITFSGTPKITQFCTHAFYGCTSLSNFKIPSSVTKIYSQAFYGCTGLTVIVIPASVTSLDRNAFDGCTSLTAVNVASGNTVYYSEGGIVYTKSDGREYLRPPGVEPAVTTIDKAWYTKWCQTHDPQNVIIPKTATSISAYAFQSKKDIISVKFESGSKLRTVGIQAFENCSNLTSITLPATVTSIEQQAFNGCSSLKSIVIPASLTSLGRRAFDGCSSLGGSITLPESLTSINDYAFEDCTSLSGVTVNCRATGKDMFKGCTGLKTIKFTEGTVTGIADYSFQDCTSVSSVVIPKSVTHVGYCSFKGMSGLTKLTLNEGLTRIGGSAFADNVKLSEVTVPSTVTNVESEVFRNCTLLKKAVLKHDPASYNNSMFYGCTSLATVSLPAGTTAIPQYMFWGCTSLKTLSLPESLKTIKSGAFQNSGLSELTIPSGVTQINDSAFSGCALLKDLTLPATLTNLGGSVFYGCTSLKNITIPATVTTMGNYVFANCTGLESVRIESVKTGSYTFRGCTSLGSVYLGPGVTDFDATAFEGCDALTEVNVDENNTAFYSIDGIVYSSAGALCYCPPCWEATETLTFDPATTSIPAGVFSGNSNITSIVIPANVNSLGAGVFKNCTGLRTVIFEAGSRLTAIPESAFEGCSDLNRVIFRGDSFLASIGTKAFKGCADLTEIRFENNNRDIVIGEYAFYNCRSLKGLFDNGTYESLGNIGLGAFYNCYEIEHLHFGATASHIIIYTMDEADDDPFAGCDGLKVFTVDEDNPKLYAVDGVLFDRSHVRGEENYGNTLVKYPEGKAGEEYTIPEGVKTVAPYAFCKNTELAKVTASSSLEYILYKSFAYTEIGELVFPGTALKSLGTQCFRNSDELQELDLSAMTGMTDIAKYAFLNCDGFETIRLPGSLTSVGEYAFYSCMVKDMELPDTVTSIGEYAFYGCSRWSNATVPASLTGPIEKYTYYNCDGLKKIIIPEGVTTIGDYAFEDCSNADELTFSGTPSITSIGFCGFYGCSRLKEVILPESLTTLGSVVFANCSKLERAEFPASLVTLENRSSYQNRSSCVFYGCKKLRQLIVKNDNMIFPRYLFAENASGQEVYLYGNEGSKTEAYVSTYNEGQIIPHFVLINKLDTEEDPGKDSGDPADPTEGTIRGAGDVELSWSLSNDGKKLTISGTGAMIDNTRNYELIGAPYSAGFPWYSNDTVEEIVIGEGITYIEGFSGMESLKKVTLPATLTGIGYYAFYMDGRFDTVNLPDALKSIGNYAFAYTGLSGITIPSGVVTLNPGVFRGCSALTGITLNEGLETVGGYALAGSGLTQLNIPATVTSFDSTALEGCNDLLTLTVSEGNDKYFVTDDGVLMGSADGETYFVWANFEGTENIGGVDTKVLYISAGVGEISMSLFRNKKDYAYVYVDEGNEYYKANAAHTAIYSKDGKVLCLVPGLVDGEFVVDNGTKEIAEYAFYDCGKITKVTIPDSVYKIGAFAFGNCVGLKEAKLPAKLGALPSYAFYGCGRLKTIDLPASLTALGYSAFYGCRSLAEINIPAGLTELGSNCFNGCSSLVSVNIPSGISEIPTNCFYACTKLRKVGLSEGLKVIDEYAFNNCKALGSLMLPEGFLRINQNAFCYCSSLARIDMPESLEYIYYTDKWVTNDDGEEEFVSSVTAFDFASGALYFYGPAGSFAESWVEDKYYRDENKEYTYFAFQATGSRKYHITYMLDPEQGEFNDELNPTSYRTTDGEIVFKPATRQGSCFGGWYLDSELATPIEGFVPVTMARDLTVYPKWLEQYTVTLNSDGGIFDTMTVTEGSSVDEKGWDKPVKDGYTFICWTDEAGNAYDTGLPVTANLTLEALFAANNTISVAPPEADVKSGAVPEGISVSLSCADAGADIYYTIDGTDVTNGVDLSGSAVIYEDSIKLTKELLHEGKITLKAVASKGDRLSRVSIYTYTFEEQTEDWGDVIPSDRSGWNGRAAYEFLSVDDVPEGLWTAGIPEETIYTGTKIIPDVRVYHHTTLLEEKTDYTIACKNNENVTAVADRYDPNAVKQSGKVPMVTISGKGNYKDSFIGYFAIVPRTILQASPVINTYTDLNSGVVLVGDIINKESVFDRVAFTGKKQQLKPVIMYNGKKLSEKKDYTIEYTEVPDPEFKASGTYHLTCTGTGNFTDTIKLAYVIREAGTLPISKAVITGFANSKEFDGDPVTQNVQLSYKKDKNSDPVQLTRYTDYVISYTGNDAVGKATMTIYGKGEYDGKLTKTFSITALPIGKAVIDGFEATKEFTGSTLYQNATLTYKKDKNSDPVRLEKGRDYEVTYLNNIAAGTATVTYTGLGKYTGTSKKSFKITPYDLNEDAGKRKPNIAVIYDEDAVYSKGGTKPDVRVTYKGMELVNGKDYTVSYKNNGMVADAGTVGEKKAPTLTVKGKSSFKGSLNFTFNIVQKDLGLVSISAPDVVYKNKAGNYLSKPVVKDTDGKALGAGKDYGKEPVYTYAEAFDNNGTVIPAGTVLGKNDIAPAGALIRVSISAEGLSDCNYSGTADTTYRIGVADLAKASVQISKEAVYVYSMKEVIPRKEDLTVMIGKDGVAPTDYEIVSCTNNVKTGKATLVLRGRKQYCGTKTITFNIVQKSFN